MSCISASSDSDSDEIITTAICVSDDRYSNFEGNFTRTSNVIATWPALKHAMSQAQ